MKFAKLAAAATLALTVSAANAATETKNFNVKITVTAACAASVFSGASVDDIDFGSVVSNPTNAALTANNGTTNNLLVECTNGSVFNVGLKPASATAGSSTGAGSMVSGSNSIPYQLKKPTFSGGTYTAGTAASANWGDQAGTTELPVTGQGLTVQIKLPVAAVIPANSLDVPAGTYTEQVTATINY